MFLMMTTTEVGGLVLKETAKALFVRMDQSHSDCWIPKSQLAGLAIAAPDEDGCRAFTAYVPEWLYRKLPMNWYNGDPRSIPVAQRAW